jgi:tetratricopeptide (TPR) repeat protein
VRVRIALLSVLTLLLFRVPAAAAEPPAYTWQDTLDNAKVNRLLADYVKLAQSEPENFELRLRAAQLCYYAWRLEGESNKRRVELGKLSLKLAKEAVALKPDAPGGYLWAGSSVALIGLPRGILNSLQLVPDGKAYLEKSIAIDPNYLNGTGFALMGHAYAVVPGFPLSVGDKNKALAYLAKARKMDPNSTLTLLFVGDLFWSMGKSKEALDALEEIAAHKPTNELEYFLDETNKRKAREMIEKIKAGEARDPLHDVISDIQPGLVN